MEKKISGHLAGWIELRSGVAVNVSVISGIVVVVYWIDH